MDRGVWALGCDRAQNVHASCAHIVNVYSVLVKASPAWIYCSSSPSPSRTSPWPTPWPPRTSTRLPRRVEWVKCPQATRSSSCPVREAEGRRSRIPGSCVSPPLERMPAGLSPCLPASEEPVLWFSIPPLHGWHLHGKVPCAFPLLLSFCNLAQDLSALLSPRWQLILSDFSPLENSHSLPFSTPWAPWSVHPWAHLILFHSPMQWVQWSCPSYRWVNRGHAMASLVQGHLASEWRSEIHTLVPWLLNSNSSHSSFLSPR